MDDSLATSFPLAGERFGRGRIAAIADPGQRQRLVVVLGMHRSGTSLCAHILSALGIDIADEIRETPTNAKGHWERLEIVEFHDRILELFNRSYFGPFHDFSLPVAWWADPRVHQIKGEIVAFLKQRMGEGDFGFKDPRTIRLMPLWHQIFNDLKLVPKIVLCLRNPAQVARSLKARDGIGIDIGEYRWLVHMADFFRYSESLDVCAVEYEEWFRDPLANFEKLRTFLDLRWQQSESDLGLVLSGIIDPALRHDSTDHKQASHPAVRSLYELARGGGNLDGAVPKQTSDLVARYVDFQRLQEPFQRAYEEAVGIAAKFLQVEQEAADLRATVAEGDALIKVANGRTSEAEARLAEAVAAVEAKEAHLGKIARERDADAAALQIARVDLASARSALIGAERREREASAASEAMSAEIASLRITVDSSERKARDAAITNEALQAQLASLRNDLTEAEQNREAATAALQKEVASFRGALAEAEQQRQQREAASTALQTEITVLQDRLSIAREVGNTALASLRIEPAVLPQAPGNAGWLMSLRRFSGSTRGFP